LIVAGIHVGELSPMLLDKLLGKNSPQTAVGPDFVIVFDPFRNAVYGLWQSLKQLLTQAFVSELCIETLDLPFWTDLLG
jgi:hypothetical protein